MKQERKVFKVNRRDNAGKLRPVDLVQMRYNGNFTLGTITKYINDKSKELYDKGFRGKFNSTIVDAPGHPFTSVMMNIGEQVDLKKKASIIHYFWHSWGVEAVDEEEKQANLNYVKYFENASSKATHFTLQIYPQEVAGGCDGQYNNCLYNALAETFGTKFTDKYKTKKGFKQSLGLKPTEKIPASLMSVIEEKIGHNIELEGDVVYSSQHKHDLTASLLLSAGHYELNKNKMKPVRVANTSFKERTPVMRAYNKDNNNYWCYDGKKHFTMSIEEMKEEESKPLTSDYLFIKQTILKREKYQQKLEQKWNEFTEQADKLKEKSKGRINMYKTGKLKNTALQAFYSTIKHLEQPDNVSQDEAEWLTDCYNGGLIFGDKYEGQAYYADVNSSYPSVLRSLIEFPYKRGQFQTLEAIPEKVKFGIYRAIISSDDQNLNKYFHINSKNKYTHIEINYAIKNKLNVELIVDDQPNFLYYSDECRLKGSQLFKEYIDYMFEFKNKHKDIHFAKKLLNVLGGACFERNRKQYRIKEHSELTLNSDEEIIHMKSLNNDELEIETCEISNQFKTGYARIYPFLTAKGRTKIGEEILKVGPEHVMRCHTDSMLCNISLPHIKDKAKASIGEIGFEKYHNKVQIINCMDVKIIE